MAPECDAGFRVRSGHCDDDAAWARLRGELWPDCSPERHEVERENYLRSPGILAFAVDAQDQPFGFAEVTIRQDHVCGTSTSPVPYLEGWFVEEAWRGRGAGRAMIEFVAEWAREQGFQELASDVEFDNIISQDAHQKLGFTETERVINYLLKLND